MIPLLISVFASMPSAQAATVTVPAAVQVGSDRLSEPRFAKLIQGKRVGVLAHAASRDSKLNHLVDVVAAIPGVQFSMIFAPEHGYRSVDDHLLPDSTDPLTKLPVYSLYGPRTAPTAEMLAKLDVVLIDLQDVGLRYYTYPATMVATMRACKAAGKQVIVLDRPNPLGGEVVEGGVLDPSIPSTLTTLASVPTRHGMTLGELALLYNDMLGIQADLTVVPMTGWTRDMTWKDTGLAWVPPSPALRTPLQTLLYAVFGTLESTNLSVGRGKTNDLAFQVYGAPWITAAKAADLVMALNALKLPGLVFAEVRWTPDRAVYAGKPSNGFFVSVTDEEEIEGFSSLLAVMTEMNRVLGPGWKLGNSRDMLGSSWLVDGVRTAAPVATMVTRARKEALPFMKLRQAALIY